MRNAWGEIDLAAMQHNVRTVLHRVQPAAVWAVVKADAYGHGAVPVARAALQAGAAGLCVALVQEGVALRQAGIVEPILVLSEQPPAEVHEAVGAGLTLTVYSRAAIAAIDAAASSLGVTCAVHLKVNTGMNRAGCQPDETRNLAEFVTTCAGVELQGVFTHFAMADEPKSVSNRLQLDRFNDVVSELEAAGLRPPLLHAANSAAALALPDSRFDLVRLGIALYGISPGPGVGSLCGELRSALQLKARVGFVRRVAAGEQVSYGLRHTFTTDTTLATVPIGYADGVPRRLSATGAEVLIGGRRCPIVGVITMDQLMVDCADLHVDVGDEVVLIGAQSATITADEWAQRLGTIAYEVVCGISNRIPRRYL